MLSYITKILSVILFIFISSQSFSQVNVNNVKTYNGSSSATDCFTNSVTDINGNIYLTGYATDEICSYIFTEKYNASGTKLWSKIYRNKTNGFDFPVSIALDSTGNIYVAGNTKRPNLTYDLLLIKYNSQGDTVWTRTYNGTSNGDDRAIKVLVDRNNNIVLAGNSSESGQEINVVMIKYNQNGNILWLKTYDGSTHLNDFVNDFTIDKVNNICVAGKSCGTQTSSDVFFIMKLNPSGDTVWTKAFKGTGYMDEAYSVITDDSLNIYATGCISGTSTNISKCFTVKINSSGVTKWTAEYIDGPNHADCGMRIGLDEIGNVIVASELRGIVTDYTIFSYGTFKYSNSGQQIWLKKSLPGAYNDGLNLIVKNSSNIYLNHPRYFYNYNQDRAQCIKYNSDGDSVWVKVLEEQYPITAVKSFAIDASGNLIFASFVAKLSNADAAIVKYNVNGILEWEKFSESVGFSTDEGRFIGEDSQDNIYVSGYNNKEYVLIKYNSSFEQQWVSTYSDNKLKGICFSITDTQGNTYLAGSTYDSLNVLMTLLLKYNNAGGLVWQRTFYSGFYGETKEGICFDNDGNILITGFATGGGSGMKVIKCTPTGTVLFSKNFLPPFNYYYIYKVAVDSDNNIFVCGSYGSAALIKLNSSGDKIWEVSYGTTYVHCFYNFCIDSWNNIYTCGYTGVQDQGYNFLTIKYDSSGNLVWHRNINGIRNSEDFARDIVVDSLGSTYVTGDYRNNPSNFNSSILTVKYDSYGNEKWRREFNSIPNGNLIPGLIRKDDFNKLYILCRYNYYLPIQAGLLTIKYDMNGDSLWSFTYNNNIAKNFGSDLLIRSTEKLYITGRAYGNNTGYDIVTLELSQPNAIKKVFTKIPRSLTLYQNYPNPFNPVTNIRFDLPKNGIVTLKVFDILGKEVATLVNEKLSSGYYEVSWDGSRFPSGVYFYKLQTEDFSEVKKMLLIK